MTPGGGGHGDLVTSMLLGGHVYEFGPFRIDPRERVLRRGEEAVALAPKAVETLLALIERRDRFVGKAELMKLVWPDAFVEETGLARNISVVRKALGDDPEGSQYIETVPKRGYRFVAQVREAGAGEAAAQTAGARRRWLWTAAALLAAGAAGLLVWKYAAGRPAAAPMRSIAVLPFRNLSHDPAQDYFAEGMAEVLTLDLARIERLRVIAPASAARYRNSSAPLSETARRLRVEGIVQGTAQMAGGRVRVTAQLTDTRTGAVLWGQSYERDLRDVFALQSELARAIARGVRAGAGAGGSEERPGRVAPEAWHAYLKGRYFWNKRTEEGLRQAVRQFEQAIAADAGYAPGHAGLADALALLGSNGYDAMPPREAMPAAKAAALRALELDDSLAEAHASLAYVHLSYEWDLPAAEKEFRRAIELNPGYATAHHWFGHYYLAAGKPDQALLEMRRALDLDPLSLPINTGVGWCLYFAGLTDRAIAQYREALSLDAGFALAHQVLGVACERKGWHDQAIGELRQAVELSGESPSAVAALAHAYASAGRRKEAAEEIARLTRASGKRYVPAAYLAAAWAGLGDLNRAGEWFRKAVAERSEYLIYFRHDPAFRHLVKDKRFQLPEGAGP